MTGSGEELKAVMAQNGIELPDEQVQRLSEYLDILWEINENINLTRHTTFAQFVERDLIDSLALAESLQEGESILDVGTGGGVPGIVLAIVRPDLRVTLCDSVRKKAEAVGKIVERLGIEVAVLHGRAENIVSDVRFNTLVIRAVAKMRKILTWFEKSWHYFDRILLVKGPAWVDERGEARHYGLLKELALRKLKTYLPSEGDHGESVILQVCRKDRLAEFES